MENNYNNYGNNYQNQGYNNQYQNMPNNINNNVERELNWDDQIIKDNEEFPLLPPGDYDFVVRSFERGRFDGSDKFPACNKAILNIEITDGKTIVKVKHTLLLHSRSEWALSAFFKSIGLKKEGQPLIMNWNLVANAKGRCNVSVQTSKKGNEFNQINKFLPPVEANTFNNY